MTDMIRQHYPNARLVAGIENGREVGKVDDEMRRQMVEWRDPPTETEQDRLYRQYADERKQTARRV